MKPSGLDAADISSDAAADFLKINQGALRGALFISEGKKVMSYITWIPIGLSVVSVIIAALTYSRNGKKDDKETIQKEESKFDGIKEGLLKANMKLDTVCATTNETRSDIKSMNKDLINIDRRVTGLETNMKQVFKELDELKEGRTKNG